MKKTMAMILAMLMALSMAACSNNSAAPATTAAAETEAAAEETEAAAETEASAETEAAAEAGESDLAYVQGKGTLVVGITDFAPMDYKDENGEWVGFDADLARAFAEELGVEVEFQEIEWNNKILELDGKSIDCVWNGMTLTEEVTAAMDCTDAYLNNAQIVIVPAEAADQYQDTESLSELNFAVENGSAGMEMAQELGLNFTEVQDQASALMEVAAGSADAAIIDSLMAAASVGEGTSYENLTYTIGLNSEEYGVGFRKGSDLRDSLNEFLNAKYADGTVQQIAETYGVQGALVK